MPKKNTPANSGPFNFIDVFCGAGGLSCGMEMNGWRCLLGVDIDQHAMKTFAHNHHHAQVYCDDICQLDEKRLAQLTGHHTIHAVVGGPPCQGFSTVGLGNPKDQRNKLFLQFVRIVASTRPYFVVMENVTGLLAKKNAKTLEAIFGQFAKLGYHMDVRILSADQYGVPERRRRTIVIGTRLDVPVEFPLPLKKTATVGEALSQLKAADGSIHNHDIASAQIKKTIDLQRLKCVPEGKGIRYEADEKSYLTSKLRLGIDWKNLRENRFRQTKYQRLDRALPSPTIMTHRHSYYHPVEHRYLTAREAAKLQSFPNDFVFTGPLSAQWRQIGNAVPPLLGKAIAGALNQMLAQATLGNDKLAAKKIAKHKVPVSDHIHEIRASAFHYRPKKGDKKATKKEARA